ncbi:MAG: hypothetical protein JNN15_09920 [Blastocatellia bacterium]|nr:hypothetical protein [Blastocatellia bacterium]
MQFLAQVFITSPLEVTNAILIQQSKNVWDYQKQGIIRAAYSISKPEDDTYDEIFILEAASIDRAREVISSLPLISRGLANSRVTPMNPYKPHNKGYFCPRS